EIGAGLVVRNCFEAVEGKRLEIIKNTFMDLKLCAADAQRTWEGIVQEGRGLDVDFPTFRQVQTNGHRGPKVAVSLDSSGEDKRSVFDERGIEKLGLLAL